MRRGSGLLLVAVAVPGTLGAGEPIFVDRTEAVGLDFVHRHGGTGERYLPETMGSGGCLLDADGDGDLDLYLVQSGVLRPPTSGPAGDVLWSRAGDGRFVDTTARAGVARRGYGQGAVCGDVDGDGDVDVYVTALGPNALLLNQGDGTFVDRTAVAGVAGSAWSSSATLFDADRDGDLDLYVVNYLEWSVETHRDCRHGPTGATLYCHPDVYPMAPDRFYRNRGDGTFEEDTGGAGLRDGSGKGLGVVAAHLDDDEWLDLYVTNDSTPNFLYLGGPGGRFREEGLILGVGWNGAGRTEAGMGVDVGDVDGDGRLDLVVTNLSLETNTLYLGGPTGFRDATRGAGLHAPSLPVLGFGVDLLDVDNDGDLDLVVVNGDVLDNIELVNDALRQRQPGQLFENDGHGRFREVGADRVGALAELRVARASLTLDHDADGRLDLVVTANDDRARLFVNRGPSGHWIRLDLRDPGSNSAAVGARVVATTSGRSQIAEVVTASSYQASSGPEVHFGLGPTEQVERTEVRWPDGRRLALLDLPADRRYVVVRRRAESVVSGPSPAEVEDR